MTPRFVVALTVFALAACAGTPPPPDWQMTARSGLDASAVAWLQGRAAVEAIEFRRARDAMARTGRPELVARAELHRCALRVATLQLEACPAFDALAVDALPEDRAYARYLANQMQPGDAALLPANHRAALAAADPAAALTGMSDPVAKLVAAGAALRRGQATPAVAQVAVDTASAQGWPRPLLAWLTLQQRAARAAGNQALVDQLQRRIDTVAPPR